MKVLVHINAFENVVYIMEALLLSSQYVDMDRTNFLPGFLVISQKKTALIFLVTQKAQNPGQPKIVSFRNSSRHQPTSNGDRICLPITDVHL